MHRNSQGTSIISSILDRSTTTTSLMLVTLIREVRLQCWQHLIHAVCFQQRGKALRIAQVPKCHNAVH